MGAFSFQKLFNLKENFIMKTKRIISFILSILCLSALFIPTASAVTQNAVIDTSRTGSLSVYKYEMDDVSLATSRGTGESSDASNVPQSATPLADVTFRIKKVADIGSTYYKPDGVTLPTPAQAASMNAINTYTQTTNASGYANFSNLPLGIYLVQETDGPSQITGRVADFVVSIPMTSENGESWNYDVKVYPKNETSYTTITVDKSDYSDGSAIAGAKFKLQKFYNNAWSDVESNITTGATGTVTPSSKLAYGGTYRLIETEAPNGYILDHTNNTTEFYIDYNGHTCDTTNHTVLDAQNPYTVAITNSKPAVEKFIDKSEGQGTDLVKQTTVNHTSGDDFDYYVVKVTTPNVDMKTLSKFTVTDTIKNCLGGSVAVVKMTNSEGTSIVSSKGPGGYSSGVQNNGGDWIVTVDFCTEDNSVFTKNSDYYIYIKCKIYTAADTTVKNKATLTYTQDTAEETNDTMDSDETSFGVGGYEAKKVDENNAALAGAEFKLYATLADANAGTNALTAFDANTGRFTTTFASANNGLIRIRDIYYGDDIMNDSQDYYLVETKAPSNDYNLLSTPIKITVTRGSGSLSNTNTVIKNVKKTTLPLTGGNGAFIWTIIGIVCVGAAASVFVLSKKSSKKDKKSA